MRPLSADVASAYRTEKSPRCVVRDRNIHVSTAGHYISRSRSEARFIVVLSYSSIWKKTCPCICVPLIIFQPSMTHFSPIDDTVKIASLLQTQRVCTNHPRVTACGMVGLSELMIARAPSRKTPESPTLSKRKLLPISFCITQQQLGPLMVQWDALFGQV